MACLRFFYFRIASVDVYKRQVALYRDFVERLRHEQRNLTEETIRNTVRLAGFEDLAQAEAAQ